jgi:hypothetical protein
MPRRERPILPHPEHYVTPALAVAKRAQARTARLKVHDDRVLKLKFNFIEQELLVWHGRCGYEVELPAAGGLIRA